MRDIQPPIVRGTLDLLLLRALSWGRCTASRFAFVAAAVFLALNGYDVDHDDAEVISAMTALADGSLGEEEIARSFRDALVPLPQNSRVRR